MFRGKTITVVVPAFNEEKLVGLTLAAVPDYVDAIVVVDDASTDDTAARVEQLAQSDTRITLIRHTDNQGVGGSVVDGYLRTIESGNDIAVVMAGDNQMPPEHLPLLLEQLTDRGYDMAKGNRFLASPTALAMMPRNRLLGNILLTLLSKLASGYWSIFDSQNGYWAVTVQILKRLDLSRIGRRYDLENSMLIQLNIASARVADVPIPAKYGHEVSGIRVWRVIPRMLLTLFTGFWQRIYRKYVLLNFHPVALFLFSGLALILWSLGIGIWAGVQSLGPSTASAGTVMLAVLPFLMGFQLILAAIVLDILSEPR